MNETLGIITMMTIDAQTLLTAIIVLIIIVWLLLVVVAVAARIVDELNQKDYQRIEREAPLRDRFIRDVKTGLSLSETIAVPLTALPTQPATEPPIANSKPNQLKIRPKTPTRYSRPKSYTQQSISNLIRSEVTAKSPLR